MHVKFAACIALAVIGFTAVNTRADMGSIGPSAKFGGISKSYTRMGDTSVSAYRIGDIGGGVHGVQPGLFLPSTSLYMGSIGGTVHAGSPQSLPAASMGGINHSALRMGEVGTRSIDILPRGLGVPTR